MSYTIRTSNGSIIAVVQDATLNTIATSLTMVGRDYAGYGSFLNENFVYLLENFAQDQKNTNDDSTSGPLNPITGQLWYDTYVKTLKVYNGTLGKWKPISSSIAQNTTPATGTLGDLWFDTAHNQLYVYAGSTAGWVLIGPPTTTAGSTSGPVVETIQDSSSGNHVVIRFYISNATIAIISQDDGFTPYIPIDGFSTIYPGLNLSTATTATGSFNQFTGSTTNALTLNGVGSNQFLRSDQNTNSAYQLTLGGGLVVGSDLKITAVTANNEVRVENVTNDRDTNFYANVGGITTRLLGLTASTGAVNFANVSVTQTGDLTTVGALNVGTTTTLNGITTLRGQLLPANVATIDIGSTTYTFNSIFATTFYGNLNGNLTANSATVTGSLTVNGNIFIASNVVATQSYVTNYVQTAGRNSQGTRTISASTPSGGNDGDIWYQV